MDNEQFKSMKIASEMVAELNRANQLYPEFRSYNEALGVIREEYLELEGELIKKVHNKEWLREECIQLGAMCIKLIRGLCDV